MRAMAIKVQLKGGHNKKEEKKILTYFYLFLLLSFCLLSGLSLPIYESQHEQVFLKTQKHVLSLQCTLFQKFIFGTKIILDRKSQCEHTLAKYLLLDKNWTFFSRVCNELLLSLVIYNRIKKRLKFVKESRVQLESSFLSFMISPKGTKDRNEDTKGNRHRKPKKKDLSIMNVPTA